MKVLVYGNGYHVKKNIVPMFQEFLDKFEIIVVVDPFLNEKMISDGRIEYVKRISQISNKNFDVCWIANSTTKHKLAFEQILRSVAVNKILIEKPMFTVCSDYTSHDLAKIKVFEASMYKYHKCWDYIQRLSKLNGLMELACNFTIPATTNFQNGNEWQIEKIIHDIGYYPIHSLISCFNVFPLDFSLESSIHKSNDYCYFHARFSKGETNINAKFGVAEEYQNCLELRFEDRIYKFNFVFSKPCNKAHLTIVKQKLNVPIELSINDANHFYSLLTAVFKGEIDGLNRVEARKTLKAMQHFIGIENGSFLSSL
jgi:hypothetical protein